MCFITMLFKLSNTSYIESQYSGSVSTYKRMFSPVVLFKVDPFSGGALFEGKQTRTYKSCYLKIITVRIICSPLKRSVVFRNVWQRPVCNRCLILFTSGKILHVCKRCLFSFTSGKILHITYFLSTGAFVFDQ